MGFISTLDSIHITHRCESRFCMEYPSRAVGGKHCVSAGMGPRVLIGLSKKAEHAQRKLWLPGQVPHQGPVLLLVRTIGKKTL